MHGPVTTPVIVLAHGVFDVLHIGHKRHLEEARALGDKLIVSITPDEHVNKGPRRPVFTAEQRKEMLLALDCVDDVIISAPTARGSIEQVKPAIYVKGIDYADTNNPHHLADVQALEALGGRCVITKSQKFSSTRIINGERLSDAALLYLGAVRDRGWFDSIRAAFDRADKLNILFVGETIIDEYRYVKPLAKPSKEFILATVKAREPEVFAGGVVAASRHAEWPNRRLVTNHDVWPTLIKSRYVDSDFTRKLFEVYSASQLDLSEDHRTRFMVRLIDGIRWADVVVTFDFGHGLIDIRERHILESAKFFAVNAQTNAGNHGFNPVTKYARADYVCVDEPEARLAADAQTETDIEKILAHIGHTMTADNIIMTQGRNGATAWRRPEEGVQMIPSFATRAVDTIGAGDAFLAVTAPLIAAGLDLEAAAFVGNVAGALKTDIVGHRRHVGRGELLTMVEGLLK